MKNTMQGTRIADGKWPENPGEYSKHNTDQGAVWFANTPNGLLGSLKAHTVIEHEDGTITVSPSILFTQDALCPGWHGYLEKGIWSEC